LLTGATLAAQQPATRLRPWQPVRVTAPAAGLDRSVEDFLAVRGDSLVLARVVTHRFDGYRMTDTTFLTVPSNAVTRLEVRALSWVRAVGYVGGLAAGAAVWSHACNGGRSLGLSEGMDCLLGLFLVPLPGALCGLLAQSMFPQFGWARVPLSSLRVQLAARPAGRLGLGAALSF